MSKNEILETYNLSTIDQIEEIILRDLFLQSTKLSISKFMTTEANLTVSDFIGVKVAGSGASGRFIITFRAIYLRV